MAKHNPDADLLAAFFASGKQVTKVAQGERTMSERDIYLANRGVYRTYSADNSEHVAERRMEVAREARLLGDRQFACEVASGIHDKAIRS